jgi:serine protease Do
VVRNSAKHYRILSALLAVVIIALGTLLWARVRIDVGVGQPTQAAPARGATLSPLQDDFVAVAQRVEPAVLSVITSRAVRVSSLEGPPFGKEIPDFRFFFGGPQEQERAVQGLGSGVVIRPDGYILTNNHVVEGADKVRVVFPDQAQTTVEARVVGTDPETDLAVIKVDRQGLTAIELGDAKSLKVGQWAIAIGSPFGLPQTMTVGVISALGRHISAPNSEFSMENMIQTDAAINRGNSGGPLVDINGRLIGVNTMIFSETGGSEGVGFAIPVDVVQYVYPQLIENRTIARGWLGVKIQNLSPEMASVWGVTQGAVIAHVVSGRPADKAGLKPGDIVVSVQGAPIKDVTELRDAISRSGPDKKLTLEIVRDGKHMEVSAKTALKESPQPRRERTRPSPLGNKRTASALGIQVQPLDRDTASQLGLSPDAGLLISEVDPNSAAYQAGLRQGQILKSMNREPTRTSAEFERATGKLGKGSKVVAFVMEPDTGTTFYMGFTL